jgi:hypothetical protein
MNKNFSIAIISENRTLQQSEPRFDQLILLLAPPQKPQIPSISGISPKEKNRYRVVLGDRPCPRCGSTSSRTGAGRRPGEASLHCGVCKRFHRWMPANELKSAKNTLS